MVENTDLLQSYHFTDKETAAYPFPRSHSKSVTEWALNPRLPTHCSRALSALLVFIWLLPLAVKLKRGIGQEEETASLPSVLFSPTHP